MVICLQVELLGLDSVEELGDGRLVLPRVVTLQTQFLERSYAGRVERLEHLSDTRRIIILAEVIEVELLERWAGGDDVADEAAQGLSAFRTHSRHALDCEFLQ